MSDQTPGLSNLGAVDGRNLINVPGGGGGIASINGDVTPAQTFNGINCSIVDNGGGSHTVSVPAPVPTPAVTSINADTTPAQTLSSGNAQLAIVDGGGGAHTLTVTALASINGDPTPAQTFVGSGCSIIDTGGGGHTISIDFPDFILGVGINLDLQAVATYNLFNVPGGFAGAVVTKVLMVLVSGDPSVTLDGNFVLNSVATAGVNDFWNNAAGTQNFSPVGFKQCVLLTYGKPAGVPLPGPLYPGGDSFQLVSAGGTDPAVFNVYVFGFLVS
jgi:hypothetical protein